MSTLCYAFLFSLPFLALGEEYRVLRQDFVKPLRFKARLLPAQSTPLKLVLAEWTTAKIKAVRPHGSDVEKEDSVLSLHLEGIEDALQKVAQQLEEETLEQNALQAQVAAAQAALPLKRQELEEEFRREEEDLQYFLEVEVPQSQERYLRYFEEAQWQLKNQQEEYDQLSAMYREDELTEETEEIILTRQRHAVQRAKWSLEVERKSYERAKGTTLPRRTADRQSELTLFKISHQLQLQALTRELRELEHKLTAQAHSLKRLLAKQARLQKDRAAMELRAPFSGTLLYGAVQDGEWKDGSSTAKALLPGGNFPKNKTVFTLIPPDSTQVLAGQVGTGLAHTLRVGMTGFFAPASQELSKIPVTLQELGQFALPSAKHYAALAFHQSSPDLPLMIEGEVTLSAATKPGALVIPRGALQEEADGTYSVELLIETPSSEEGEGASKSPALEGTTQAVEVGMSSKDFVEVLSGLKEGDLIQVQ